MQWLLAMLAASLGIGLGSRRTGLGAHALAMAAVAAILVVWFLKL